MPDFPEQMIVSAPPGFLEQQSCRVILRLFDVGRDAARLAAPYGKRISHIDMNGKTLASLPRLDLLAEHRIRLFVSDADIPLIHRISKTAVKHRLVLFVQPDAGAARRINLLSEFDIPMHIDPGAGPAAEGVLPQLLEYYLHNPLLNASIAPFNALMKHEIEGKGYTLWDTEYEKPGRYLYLSAEGDISLSGRFHRAGVVFGTRYEAWEQIAGSEAYRRLLGYRDAMFEKGEPCAFCAGFRFCQGYLKAVDADADCEQWQRVFEGIGLAVDQARGIIRDGYGKRARDRGGKPA